MQTWIALLRGVNVGGNNILPMKELRTLLEKLGLKNVRTYIQSGNCIFETENEDARSLGDLIADNIAQTFGFQPNIMVISKETLAKSIAENPYPEAEDDPKSLHIFFLVKPAENANLSALDQIKTPSERFSLSSECLYLYTPEGFGRSKLAGKVEKHLGVPITARNLRSVMKIAALAV